MRKRVLAGMMMAVLVVASAMSVSAAPSKEKPISPVGSSEGKYEIVADTEKGISSFVGMTDDEIDKNDKISADKKEEAKKATKDALEKIAKINDGGKVGITAEVDQKVEGKTLVQKFFELKYVGGTSVDKHTIVLKVDELTTAWKNIVIVHYSSTRCVWETVVPTVDYNNKTLTFELQDLSPLAIYADVDANASNGTSWGTEGLSSTWMLYSAMALIVLGTGVVVYQKKRG